MQSQEPRLCVYQLSLWYLLELVTLKCVRDTVLATIISFNTTYTYTYVHICIHSYAYMHAVCCSALQCVALYCILLQCVAVCCSVTVLTWCVVLLYQNWKYGRFNHSLCPIGWASGPPVLLGFLRPEVKQTRIRKQVSSHWESSQNSSCYHVASPCSSTPPFVDNHGQSRWPPTSSTRSDSFKQCQK